MVMEEGIASARGFYSFGLFVCCFFFVSHFGYLSFNKSGVCEYSCIWFSCCVVVFCLRACATCSFSHCYKIVKISI